MKPIRYALSPLMLVVAVACLLIAGCSAEQIETYRQVKAEMQAALDATNAELARSHQLIDELDVRIEALQDGPEKDAAIVARDKIARVIEKGKAAVAELQIGIDRSQAAIDALIAGDGAAAIQAIGPYIASKTPPPWNVYILAGTSVAGFVLSYMQKRKKDEAESDAKNKALRLEAASREVNKAIDRNLATRMAAESVITAIEREKDGGGVVNFNDEAVKTSLRSRMSTEARELVEGVRRDQPARLRAITAPAQAVQTGD